MSIDHCQVILSMLRCAISVQQAKISDFGLSSQLLAGATHRSTRTTGTITHTAPEVLQTAKITPAADVYAFGIMSELLLGQRRVPGSCASAHETPAACFHAECEY